MKEIVYVGIPVLEEYKAHMVDCLLRLFDYWRANPVFTLLYTTIIGSRQIHFARNALVRSGLNANMDYMAFLDADMVFPPDALHKLYFASKDITGVIYPGRCTPHPANVFYWNKDKTRVKPVQPNWKVPKSKLIEVDAVGTGVMLIRKRVFKELPTPWFFYEADRSEDIMFCEKARKHGFKIHVDTTIKCGHVGDEIFWYGKK